MLTDEERLTAVSCRITLILQRASTLNKVEMNELVRLTAFRERLFKQCTHSRVVETNPAPAKTEQNLDRTKGERTKKIKPKPVKN